MNIYFYVLIILITEVLFTLVFGWITPKKHGKKRIYFEPKSVAKGLIERFFLTYSLCSGFPHALTLFGALKLGTRLRDGRDVSTTEGRKKENQYNDYYLIGNLISVALSIAYYNLYTHI